MFSVAPNATITGVELAPEWLTVTWALFAGDVICLQLRHTSVASMDVIIPVSSWTVLKDNIQPDQNNVFVNDTTIFNLYKIRLDRVAFVISLFFIVLTNWNNFSI